MNWMMKMKQHSLYTVLEEVTEDGFHLMEMNMGEFKGLQWTYGKISINENGEEATLQFEYNIKNRDLSEQEQKSFKQLAGDILVSIIEEQLDKNEVIYSGGTE